MARRSNSSGDDGEDGYSRRRTDRKVSKPSRRRRSYSRSESESPSRVNSSDSDTKRRRKRGSEIRSRSGEDKHGKPEGKSRKERYDSSSDEGRVDGEVSDRTEDVGREKRDLGREKGKKYDSNESGSDDSRRKRKANGGEDRENTSRGDRIGGDDEGDRKLREKDRTGRGKNESRYNRDNGGSDKGSPRNLDDEDEDMKDRRPVNGRDEKKRGGMDDENRYGREDKYYYRKERRSDRDDDKKERKSDRDDDRKERRSDRDDDRKERRSDGDDDRKDGKSDGEDGMKERRSGRDDDRKERRSGRDDDRKERRSDRDDDRKERKRDRDDHRKERKSDGHDDRKERRSDRYDDRKDRKTDRDDDRKERRSDRDGDRGRRGKEDERDHRRSDEEDRRNLRTEERVGDGNASEDPRARMPDVNLIMNLANTGRSGGVYIPPFKLARMMKEVDDKSSVEYQRMTWDALRKSINGLVNKVNSTNAKNIIPELFAENLIRGRGLFCRSCMKSQMASPGFTDVFAALVAVVNTKFPEVGDLLIRRIILQLQRAFKRNDKPLLLAVVKFIAHLVNQQVVHELIALELLTLLLRDPTDDSVEVAVGFVTECGSMLQDLSPKGLHAIFERFRGILHEGEIDKRVQFLIEGLFALRKAKFQNYPAVRPELDLVELVDQITHEISLSAEIDPETSLDIFNADPNFLENEKRYEDLKKQILGEESEDDDEESGAESDEDSEEESDEDDEEAMQIKDETETNLVNLRRTIYLTIMSSVDFEEAGHKLLKIKLEPGQEMELCIMLLECCSQERTYLRYYGLLGQRFCMINKVHQENFEKCFVQQYSMIHRLETNKLRNVAKFFAHLLGTDALPWHVLAYIRLTEEDTTSSSRIFIKILFQELSEHLGIRLLNERLNEPTMQESLDSIFPKDNPKNTRFAINFFTSIGLGGITENLREYLKNMPRLIMQQQKPPESEEESGSESSDSGSSSSSSSSDESDSESERDDRRKRRRRR